VEALPEPLLPERRIVGQSDCLKPNLTKVAGLATAKMKRSSSQNSTKSDSSFLETEAMRPCPSTISKTREICRGKDLGMPSYLCRTSKERPSLIRCPEKDVFEGDGAREPVEVVDPLSRSFSGIFGLLFTRKGVSLEEEGLGALFFLGLISLGEEIIGDEFFLFSAVAKAVLSEVWDKPFGLLKTFCEVLEFLLLFLGEEVVESVFFGSSILEKFEFFPESMVFSEFLEGFREPS
jgi:hypothetical protein